MLLLKQNDKAALLIMSALDAYYLINKISFVSNLKINFAKHQEKQLQND